MTGKDFDKLNEAYHTQVNEGLPAVAVKAVVGKLAKDAIKNKLNKKDEEEAEETEEAAKPDYIDADGDGNKKEPMKKALKDKKKKVQEKATDQRPKDEVKSDAKLKDSACERIHDDLQEPIDVADEDQEKEKKSKKTAKESINNSNKGTIMSEDKSTFDKLYESVMGEDDDFELGIPGDDGLDIGDDAGDEGGEVTITLTPDQASALKAIVDQLAPEEPEEDPLGEPEAEEESFEAVEEDTTQTKDGAKPGTDPSDGGGKATDPAADSLGGKSSGTGETPVTDEIDGGKDTGEGKKPGDTKAKGAGKPGTQAV